MKQGTSLVVSLPFYRFTKQSKKYLFVQARRTRGISNSGNFFQDVMIELRTEHIKPPSDQISICVVVKMNR